MEEQEFLRQIREHQGIIHKVTGLYAADPEEKKDLIQEILLQTWKSRNSFIGQSKFSTWLYRISLNTVFTAKRKKKLVDYVEEIPNEEVVLHPAIEKENALSLQKAIRMLHESDRAIISLHLDGYTNPEIVELIGISQNNVAVRIHRIKLRLSKLLIPEKNG